MSSTKYIKAAVANVEEALKLAGHKLPARCPAPMTSGYRPEVDELLANGLQYFQELIGVLRWACKIGRIDILTEVLMLSTHLALPRKGHLKQVYHIFNINNVAHKVLHSSCSYLANLCLFSKGLALFLINVKHLFHASEKRLKRIDRSLF